MAVYSIKDLEKLSGIKAHTIRIWEKRYNLVQPKRTSTNIRLYTDEDLKRLLNISILNRKGVKISKIAELDSQELTEQIKNYARGSWSSESQIEYMIISMIELDERKFEKILSKTILQLGFEETILTIVYPFFVRIGIMWQTGTINPAQEHFISNLVRQKILVAIDGIIPSEKPARKRFILFLPEGELHEMALLFMCYLIKKRGHDVIYLGQSLPVVDVVDVNRILPSEFLLTYFTSALSEEEIERQLNQLSKSFTDLKILIAGSQLEEYKRELPTNVTRISSPRELISLVEPL